MQCVHAAAPRARRHVQVRLGLEPNNPSHQAGQQKAASTLPAQKHPGKSASPSQPFCLEDEKQMLINFTDLSLTFCLWNPPGP